MTDDPMHAIGEPRPEQVTRTVAFLAERRVSFVLGRNQEAGSCRDAARKRVRLGKIGIPLWDELKSFFGVVRSTDGDEQYLAIHCRGDRIVDLKLVALAIRCCDLPERANHAVLAKLGIGYGLVNPFEPWTRDGAPDGRAVLQVFDRDLLVPIGDPGTVMTNAGSLTWSVELRADELAYTLEGPVVADISRRAIGGRGRPKRADRPMPVSVPVESV